MTASRLPGAEMRRQGLELALQTKPSAQPLLHITEVLYDHCPQSSAGLSPFLSR